MNAIEFVKKYGAGEINKVIKTGGSNDEIGEVFIDLDYACLESVLFEIGSVSFVRNCGISEAKRVLHDARGCASVDLWDRFSFETDDLQNLVNAYELVESFGGLEGAKGHLNHRREYGLYPLPALKQAIDLVEQCNAKP